MSDKAAHPLRPAPAAEFELLYRAHVDAVTAFFARRSADPQTVADLTADIFVQVIISFRAFDPARGAARAWVFGIARRVYAAHCEAHCQQRSKVARLAGRRELDRDEVDELLDRIDAERAGRRLVTELTALPESDRAVIELVDIAGLLLAESARVPYIAQALISPDGSTITAVVLTGRARGAHQVSGFLPGRLSVTRISVATGAPLRVLYHRRLGPSSQVVGAPDCLILSQDTAGRHWLLDGGISGGAGYSNGFDGWIDAGRLVPLPPMDGAVSGQAW